MKQQNVKNHTRFAPKIYYAVMLSALIVLVLVLLNFLQACSCINEQMTALYLAVLAFGVIITTWYARAFALKAQDRAIRAEENLRHFALTGKLLDNRLSISQVIALRFAADDEFVALAKKAADEQLSNKQIKECIQQWRADWYRV